MRKAIILFLSCLYTLPGALADFHVNAGRAEAGHGAEDNTTDYRVLLYEDFSLFTAGSEERPSANPVNDQLQMIPDNKTLSPGWQGVEIYQAGGIAYQGIDGKLFTPNIDLSKNGGKFKITFRMKLAPGSPDGWANVVHANISSQSSVKLTEQWQTITYIFDGGTRGDYVAIRAVDMNNPSSSRVKAFIDDIVVEVPDPKVESPTGLTYDNFDGTGFNAFWNGGAKYDRYELRLYTVGTDGSETDVPGDFTTTRTDYQFTDLDENWNGYRLQVRGYAGTEVSPWSTPVSIEGIAAPALNPAQITDDGFIISWGNVENAYKYEVRTFIEHTPADDEQFFLADTDFSFVHPRDLGSETEVGFDEMPGWFFGCADLQEGYIGVQGAFSYLGYAAQIESPRLNLSGSGGKISVEFKAKNDDSRTGVAVALFSREGGDYQMVDEHRIDGLSKNWYTVRASLSGGGDNSILAIIPTRSGNVYVDDLKVWQNVKAGVKAHRLERFETTTGNSITVKGINCPAGDAVCYSVRTVGASSDKSRWLYSPDTELTYPYGGSAIQEVGKDSLGEPSIRIIGHTVHIENNSDATIRVFDLTGRPVPLSDLYSDGDCRTFTIPSAGIYLINIGTTTSKVVIR